MKIREVLQKKGTEVVTIAPEKTVTSLVELLNEHRIGHIDPETHDHEASP